MTVQWNTSMHIPSFQIETNTNFRDSSV